MLFSSVCPWCSIKSNAIESWLICFPSAIFYLAQKCLNWNWWTISLVEKQQSTHIEEVKKNKLCDVQKGFTLLCLLVVTSIVAVNDRLALKSGKWFIWQYLCRALCKIEVTVLWTGLLLLFEMPQFNRSTVNNTVFDVYTKMLQYLLLHHAKNVECRRWNRYMQRLQWFFAKDNHFNLQAKVNEIISMSQHLSASNRRATCFQHFFTIPFHYIKWSNNLIKMLRVLL